MYRLVALLMLSILTACTNSDVQQFTKNTVQQENGDHSDSSVTNQSDQGKVKSLKKVKPLKDIDFSILYKSFLIDQKTDVNDMILKLGYGEGYEDNNEGYLNGNEDFRRWDLSYPNYANPEIRFIILSQLEMKDQKMVDGASALEAVSLESSEFTTQRGLKVGDKVERVLQLYGQPDTIEEGILTYSKDELRMEITLDQMKEKVANIFILFREQPDWSEDN